jgi:trans-aconitate 2-methyltransferase
MPWDPAQYHKFSAERSAPFDDLLKLVHVRTGLRVVDLGCGTGELTRKLADTLPDSDILGLDFSMEMLDAARAAQFARPGLRFEQGDQSQLEGEWDVIFSNAALQWSEDHASLIPRLFARLKQGGQMAIQMPSNHDHISHRKIREVAGCEPFRSALNGWTRRSPVLPIEAYAELLFQQEAEQVLIFEKVYPHVLENADAIVEWISGTALVPYFERLNEALRELFVQVLRNELRLALPGQPVFYPFKRTFLSAFRHE